MEKKRGFLLGYSLIIHSILTYFIFGAFTTSGMNVWIPAFCGAYGWSNATLLIMATIASLVGVAGAMLFGQLVSKRGARLIIAVTMTLCGVFVILFGQIQNVWGYLVCMTVFNFAGHGFCNVGSNAVIANWFPRSKGFVLGITTMGLPAASFLFVPILSVTIGSAGISKAFLGIGLVIAVLGVCSWFWVRDTPQEVGALPDHGKYPVSDNGVQQYESKWTAKRLLSNRNVWLIAIAYGLLFLTTQGMVSQTVSYLVEVGFEQAAAVKMLSMAAAVGIVGSFIWGILDNKMGTKKASVIYSVWYIVTFVLLASNINGILCMLGILMLGASLGGIGNLMPSMMITAFGAREFASVSRVVTTVGNIIRSLAFFVMAIGIQIFGTYCKTAYLLLLITVVSLLLILWIKPEKETEKGV